MVGGGLLIATDDAIVPDAGMAMTLGLGWMSAFVASGIAWYFVDGRRGPGRAGLAGAIAGPMAMVLLGAVLGGGTLALVPVMVLTVGVFLLPAGVIVGLVFWYARCRKATAR